jgi:hypothetical protein
MTCCGGRARRAVRLVVLLLSAAGLLQRGLSSDALSLCPAYGLNERLVDARVCVTFLFPHWNALERLQCRIRRYKGI